MSSAFAFKDGSIYTIAAILRIGSGGCQEERNEPGIYVSKREPRRALARLGRVVRTLAPKAHNSAKKVNS